MTSNLYKTPEFETLQLHAGQTVDRATNARAPPIYATTSFVFNDTQHGADLFSHRAVGNVYSRVANPTVQVFEERMAALEGGVAAVAAASGQSAQIMAILALAGSGDNIVASTQLYGGVILSDLNSVTLPRLGITTKFVSSPTSSSNAPPPSAFAAAIDEHTKAIYIESISNPSFAIPQITNMVSLSSSITRLAWVVILSVLLSWGRYFHSATKWIGGHGTTIGGVVIDSGNFDWLSPLSVDKFPTLTKPSQGYHGIVFAEKFGRQAFAICMLRDIGPAMNPFAAFLLLQGLETLSLRGQRHCDNALALAQYLEAHPSIAWVSYPGLKSHPSHKTAVELLRPNAFGGVLSFGVKEPNTDSPATIQAQDRLPPSAACKVVDGLRLASNLANVGDAKTLVIHPASTTHGQMSLEEQSQCGVTPDLIRVSVGIENISDIIADFENALKVLATSS
ncbi:hypothetical protein ONZ45_g12794 [Pleurotus djamor]|nr:hypothetical protein ONZ45_g12794 [Pleurotus djamor]